MIVKYIVILMTNLPTENDNVLGREQDIVDNGCINESQLKLLSDVVGRV